MNTPKKSELLAEIARLKETVALLYRRGLEFNERTGFACPICGQELLTTFNHNEFVCSDTACTYDRLLVEFFDSVIDISHKWERIHL